MKKRIVSIYCVLSMVLVTILSATAVAADNQEISAGVTNTEKATLGVKIDERFEWLLGEKVEQEDQTLIRWLAENELEDRQKEESEQAANNPEEKVEIKKQELAYIVIQPKEAETETEIPLTEMITETEATEFFPEDETASPETYVETEAATIAETEAVTETEKIEYNDLIFTRKQRKYIDLVSKYYEQVVVIFNRCVPQDELCLMDKPAVAAVLQMDEDGHGLDQKLLDLDVKAEKEKYLEKVKLAKEANGETELQTPVQAQSQPQGQQITGDEPSPGVNTGEIRALSGTTNQSESESESESESASDTDEDEDVEDDDNPARSASARSSKDVTFKQEYTPVWEDDSSLSLTYYVASNKALTEGKVTITYDKNKMTYNNVTKGDAIGGDFLVNIKTPEDEGTEEGTIEISFSIKTAQKLDGTFVDLDFDLEKDAKLGETHKVSMKVDKLKNGSTDLTSQVLDTSVKVTTEDGEESESESETKKNPTVRTVGNNNQSSTNQSTNTTPKTSPKTGDDTAIILWVVLMCMSASGVLYANFRRRSQAK